MRRRICCMGGRRIRGIWRGRRADRAAASRRRLRRACRRLDWAATARVGARAGAFYGDLLAEADAGTDSGARASAAVRGSVFDSGRDWSDGADDGRCGALVSHAERAGSAGSGERAGCVAGAGPGGVAVESDWIFRGRWAGSGDGGDAGGGAIGRGCATGSWVSRGAVQAEHAGGAAEDLG